ncbi:MAG TPA: TetR/AcrR family transcriptional regulator [Candidatus Acidoferrales bacterium]|nr:TetR/AcrR family transcriptional regulator [Candidatus Acidoferrales bacterium]
MSAHVERGTRERILEVAESSLGEHGYHGTRLHQIAQQVGIQKASLFHYFSSKEHLYRAVIEEAFGETEQVIRCVLESEAAAMEKVRGLVDAYVEMVAAHPERTKILLRQSLGDAPSSQEQPPELRRLMDVVAAFITEGQRAQVFAAIDPTALVLSVIGMVAFFFTSGPVVAPEWFDGGGREARIARIKRHVLTMVQRSLGCCDCVGGVRKGHHKEEVK